MTRDNRINTSLIDKAMTFAMNAHSDTPRKGTEIPYILHPAEAAAIVSSMTSDIEVIVAAILHDTVEDNPDITLYTIEREFGMRIRKYVAAESEKKEVDEKGSWKKRKSNTIESLMNEKDENIKKIALADKLSNIRAIYKDQLEMGDELWQRFNQPDKQEQGWYYKSLKKAFESLSQYPACKEYCDLVDRVFGR